MSDFVNTIGEDKGPKKSYRMKFTNSLGNGFDVNIMISDEMLVKLKKEFKKKGMKIHSIEEIPN